MLTRLYVDNFRCLVNFEMKLDRTALLLGANGSGKTTVFDVLRRLQRFLLGSISIRAAFPSSSMTRWQIQPVQTIELELQVGATTYAYRLDVRHDRPDLHPYIFSESLLVNGLHAFLVQESRVKLQQNNGTFGDEFPFDPTQSVIGSFLRLSEHEEIHRFKKEIEKFVIASIETTKFKPSSREEVRFPMRSMQDFVSWYRYLSQEYQGAIFSVTQELRAVLPGFYSFSLKESGKNTREMQVIFQADDADSPHISYKINELSDGQRVLIVLYTLLYGLEDRGAYLFLDEPENFVALREIQPWLTALTDTIGGGIKQAVIISHHPEIINYLGSTSGRWFNRTANGPARISDQPPVGADSSLQLSETIARGWEK